MWENFFSAGGFGMYPTLVFGFLLVGAIGMHALKHEPRFERVVLAFSILTIASGILGTAVGICNSALYLDRVPAEKQLQTFALGCQESLHNLILALMIVIIAGLFYIGSSLRRRA